MYDSDSDITEDDGDYKASTNTARSRKAGSASQSKGGYRIKGVLKVPRPTTYTTQAIYEQIHSSDISLEPEYQREVVWPEAKQIGLIDSIFRNFYIPPVIFAVNQFEDGSETKTCIDGKQRLTSIYRFMDGLICHKDPFTNEKLWYKDVGSGNKGPKKKLLPEKYRRLFANKQIVCIEYQDITDDDEREIFQRVQLGMALTPAEKLQAVSGPMPAFVRELNATYLCEGGLVGDSLDWDRSRGADFRCLATALYVIDKFSPDLSSYGTMLQLERWLTRSGEPTAQFRDKIHNTFNVLLDLSQDKAHNGVFNKPTKISPIEFTMISVLVAVHKDKLTPAQLSTAIKQLRADVRQKHQDIRMNGRVGRTMIEFIKELRLSKVDGHEGGESAGSLVKAGKKRKRQEQPAPNRDNHDPAPPTETLKPKSPQDSKDSMLSTSEVVSRNTLKQPVPDRLAAIRAAKVKLASTPILIPHARPPVLRNGVDSQSFSTKPKVESNPLEGALMARMNSSLSMASNRAAGPLDPGDIKPTRSRPSSPGGRTRSRSRSRDREYERDREWNRQNGVRRSSISSDRSAQTRRPHDGTRDWDYVPHRSTDRQYSDGRRDSNPKWDDYR